MIGAVGTHTTSSVTVVLSLHGTIPWNDSMQVHAHSPDYAIYTFTPLYTPIP